MSAIVLLDAGPLGLVSNPSASVASLQCLNWIESHLLAGSQIIVPEIADYEVRRELLRAGKTRGLERLDLVKKNLKYLPLSTNVMLTAAGLWAMARNRGKPTADATALDCDVILAAQALEVKGIVATTNVGHLSLFVEAAEWQQISPSS